ncbi:MAG: PIN domain-containing protein [Deferrisomatales bacterium]|nr:PIN domain-containing protein [Deferrisomatales bacterium]
MADRFFVDTNVLVYAHDTGQGVRHQPARALVERLWEDRSGVLSTQVIQELYVNLRRKAARPVPADEARRLVEDYLCWPLVVNDGNSILGALQLEQDHGISFWDALILDAANRSGARILYSEDLNHGQTYGATTVVNPFAD